MTGIVSVLVIALISCEKNPDFNDKTSGKIKVNDLNLIGYVSQPVCGSDLHADIFAGKNTKAGEVLITLNGDLLNVTFSADDGWAFSETHLSVTNSLDEVPATEGGNPAIGLFEYHANHTPAVTEFTYNNISVDGNSQVYILAHAEVRPVLQWKTNLEEFSNSLPAEAIMSVQYPVAGSTSYFKTTITEGGILDDTFNGWCIDVDNVIYNNMDYPVKVISSYDPGFSSLGLVENPQNMDLVNWIISQNFPGTAAPDFNTYTYGDVQRAIWELLDDNYSESGLGLWSEERVKGILEEAAANGEDFVPQCGDKIAVILLPVDLTQPFQITMVEYPAACDPVYGSSETAWAAGYDFGGSNWAKYFTFCISQ